MASGQEDAWELSKHKEMKLTDAKHLLANLGSIE
jgi:hypothetical protein